jgi:hypothetical protein
MTILEALAILEAGVLECKKKDIDTPEMREALDFLEPLIFTRSGSSRSTAIMSWATTELPRSFSKANSRCFAQLSQESVTEFENFSECERMH